MSAGPFEISKYQAEYDAGDQIHPIRVQPETIALTLDGVTNAPVTAAKTNSISAQVSKGRRSIGLNARMVRIKFTETTPEGYKPDGVITLPLLNVSIKAKAGRGTVGTYLTLPIVVVGSSAEKVN